MAYKFLLPDLLSLNHGLDGCSTATLRLASIFVCANLNLAISPVALQLQLACAEFKIVSNILISSFISLAVSISVFIFGVRVGKERMDREVMREKYTELFEHFKKLSDIIKDKKFKSWDTIWADDYAIELVHNYDDDGTLNLFPPRLRKKMLNLETDILGAQDKTKEEVYNRIAPRIDEVVISALKKEAPQPESDSAARLVEMVELAFMSETDFEDLKSEMNAEPKKYLTLNTFDEQEKGYLRDVRSDNLECGNLADFIDHLKTVVSEEMKEIHSKLGNLKKRLESMVSLLKKRKADPHPLWLTVYLALSDIFRK